MKKKGILRDQNGHFDFTETKNVTKTSNKDQIARNDIFGPKIGKTIVVHGDQKCNLLFS